MGNIMNRPRIDPSVLSVFELACLQYEGVHNKTLARDTPAYNGIRQRADAGGYNRDQLLETVSRQLETARVESLETRLPTRYQTQTASEVPLFPPREERRGPSNPLEWYLVGLSAAVVVTAAIKVAPYVGSFLEMIAGK